MRLRAAAHPAENGDLRLHRPGLFTVDECRDCGHTFQNPRLTPRAWPSTGARCAAPPRPRHRTCPRPARRTAPPPRHGPRDAAVRRTGELAGRRHRTRPLPGHGAGVLPVHRVRRHRPHLARRAGPRARPGRGGPRGAAHRPRGAGPAVRPLRRGQPAAPPGAHHRPARRTARRPRRPAPRRPPADRDPRPALCVRRPVRPLVAALRPAPAGCTCCPAATSARNSRRAAARSSPLTTAPPTCRTTWQASRPSPCPTRSPAPDTPWRAIPPSPAEQHLRTALLRAGTPWSSRRRRWTWPSPPARHTPLANTYRVIARKPKR